MNFEAHFDETAHELTIVHDGIVIYRREEARLSSTSSKEIHNMCRLINQAYKIGYIDSTLDGLNKNV
jgi:hypothetical protein